MTEPKRQRSLYEIASIAFAAVVIAFAIMGLLVTALGDDGPGSSAFLICLLFLALGLGRLYLGLRRGNEGAEEPPPAAARKRQQPTRRPPPRRRRP